jgi:hypothetical protein
MGVEPGFTRAFRLTRCAGFCATHSPALGGCDGPRERQPTPFLLRRNRDLTCILWRGQVKYSDGATVFRGAEKPQKNAVKPAPAMFHLHGGREDLFSTAKNVT